MSDEFVIITPEAVKELRIGELMGTRTFYITDKLVKKYCLSLRETNPLWLDNDYAAREGRFGKRVLPSAFCVALNPMEAGGHSIKPVKPFLDVLRNDPSKDFEGAHAAYNGFEYFKPICFGDTITCEVRNRKYYEKFGKRTILVAVETEYKMIAQDGETRGVGTYGSMCQFAYPEGHPKE